MESTALLSVMDLKKIYRSGKKETIISDITFSLQTGETLGLVGQSGSGKTTVARMIAGMELPTSGGIMLEGKELGHSRTQAQKKAVQYIFQEPFSSLNPKLKVKRILSEPLQLYFNLSHAEIDKRVDELLDEVGLPIAFKDRYPRELSGGQCQRIGIARAIAAEPKLIICDEPTSALDMTVQKQIIDLLKRIQEEKGIGYLFIAHSLDVVYSISDNVLVMNNGQVVEYGTKDKIFNHPENEYTKALITAIPKIAIPYY